MKKVTAATADDTINEGLILGSELNPGSVIVLYGTLGSGKTTFVKGLAKALGIIEEITSPTFTIISEYEGKIPLYHMDLYRISSEQEFEDTGGADMLYRDGICVIEWPEQAEEFLPENTISVSLSIGNRGERLISIDGLKT